MSIGKDKGDLAASFDRGQREARLYLIQADAQILELAEGIISIWKNLFFPYFPYFFPYSYIWGKQ
jgi:hypothetical protein